MAQPATLFSFGVTNFKSYEEATLSLRPLTLLIGANASGKSNLLEALRLLSWMATGGRLDQLPRATPDDGIAFRGRLADFARTGTSQFGLNVGFWKWLIHDFESSLFDFSTRIETHKSAARIQAEQIKNGARTVPLYELKNPASGVRHDVDIAYDNFRKGGKKPIIPGTDQQLLFTQLRTPASFNSAQSQRLIPSICGALATVLQQVLFLDPDPRRMRAYVHAEDRRLSEDGSTLSGVLFNLCKTPSVKSHVLDFIRDLPEQDILDIGFVETPRGEVMVALEESFAGKKRMVEAPLLSDGTLRVLSVAAAVLSAVPGSLVVIEEIDNGVHPGRAGQLLENIQKIAKQRELKVLLTSHNPAMLDALPEEAVPDVACCYRDPKTGVSKLVRLADLPSYPELIAQGTIGRLMTQGILDRMLKRPTDATARRERGLKWLKQWEAAAT